RTGAPNRRPGRAGACGSRHCRAGAADRRSDPSRSIWSSARSAHAAGPGPTLPREPRAGGAKGSDDAPEEDMGIRNRNAARWLGTVMLAGLASAAPVEGQAAYVPGPHPDWERRDPAEVGFDAAALQAAIDLAIASESTAPRDLELNHDMTFGREPRGEAVGPFRDRGHQTGIVVRHGYIVAEWGDPARVDQTFSVAKTFLSTTVGLAVHHGLIGSVEDRARDYVPPLVLDDGDGEPGDQQGRRPKALFDSEHNR